MPRPALCSGWRPLSCGPGVGAGGRKVLWHNMREEPVLYINGRPYVVREADKPFQNLEYTGIDRSRVEEMETRLKADVLLEVRPPGIAQHRSALLPTSPQRRL